VPILVFSFPFECLAFGAFPTYYSCDYFYNFPMFAEAFEMENMVFTEPLSVCVKYMCQ